MWLMTPLVLVWLSVPESVPECGAVERPQGWATDDLVTALAYQQAAV